MSDSGFILTGGTLITPTGEQSGSLVLSGDLIHSVAAEQSSKSGIKNGFETVDVTGCFVSPGLVDLQVNGGFGCNLWGDPTPGEFDQLCTKMLTKGVTTFLPTLITDSISHLQKNIAFLESVGVGQKIPNRNASDKTPNSSGHLWPRLPGIHLEGPFLSPHKPGVHPPQHIIPLELPSVLQLLNRPDSSEANGLIRLITLAPETAASADQSKLDETLAALVSEISKHDTMISLGHSNATFDEARRAFDSGIKLVTHIFNAMPPIHHRQPGAVAAALLDKSVNCCVICDGLHLSKEAVQLVLALKGIAGTVLVTDIAEIGTTGGGLVGSSITLDDAVRNIVNWGLCSFADAIQMASKNPAQVLGLSDVGSLKPGFTADIVVWNKSDLTIQHVFVSGRKVP